MSTAAWIRCAAASWSASRGGRRADRRAAAAVDQAERVGQLAAAHLVLERGDELRPVPRPVGRLELRDRRGVALQALEHVVDRLLVGADDVDRGEDLVGERVEVEQAGVVGRDARDGGRAIARMTAWLPAERCRPSTAPAVSARTSRRAPIRIGTAAGADSTSATALSGGSRWVWRSVSGTAPTRGR